MHCEEMKLKGVFKIALEPHLDERGFFVRTYDKSIFTQFNLCQDWVQENHSYSKQQGTIRGLHFQFPPAEEARLIRVGVGSALMVYVDLRKNSPTLGKWESIVLSRENNTSLFVPRGFALGMKSMVDHCHLFYKMDNYYEPEKQGILRWNDPDLGIDWQLTGREPLVISQRDRQAPSFKEFILQWGGL